MEFTAHEAVEVEMEVDVQDLVETDDKAEAPESNSPLSLGIEKELHDEFVDLNLLTTTQLRHEAQSGTDEGRDHGHICPHCGNIYEPASKLSSPGQLKQPPNEQPVQCSECLKMYSSAMSLQKHVQYMHKFKYRCSTCNENFGSPEILDFYMLTCGRYQRLHPKWGKMYVCGVCMLGFDEANELQQHITITHKD